MAQNVTVQGASYSNVPAVILPKTGGGSATFTDVTDTTATASDVASGKYFYTAAGTKTQGTGTSGGYITQDQNGYVVLSPTSGVPTLINKTITESGTYNPASDGATGYSSVTVNVSSGATFEVKAAYASKSTSMTVTVSGEPMAFALVPTNNVYLTTDGAIAALLYDGTDINTYVYANGRIIKISNGGCTFSYSNSKIVFTGTGFATAGATYTLLNVY